MVAQRRLDLRQGHHGFGPLGVDGVGVLEDRNRRLVVTGAYERTRPPVEIDPSALTNALILELVDRTQLGGVVEMSARGRVVFQRQIRQCSLTMSQRIANVLGDRRHGRRQRLLEVYPSLARFVRVAAGIQIPLSCARVLSLTGPLALRESFATGP